MEDQSIQTPKSGLNPLLIVGVLLLLALGTVYAFTRTDKASSVNPTNTQITTAPNSTNFEDDGALPPVDTAETSAPVNTDTSTSKTVSLEAGSFYYKPNAIRVKQGDTITITMKSADMMHDFNIDELNVKMPITKAGETGTVTFTATQKGTFEFYCSVGNHKAQGQVGTLIVE
jgi:heme/copper-type cytochrome/quinol oxidase subunit 2